MAVEIPVYVNIKGAFDQAAQDIPKEMPKLQKIINENTLKLKFDVGEGYQTDLRNILTGSAMNATQLKNAMVSIRAEFDKASAASANMAKRSAQVNNLAKAYALVEQRLTGVYNKTTAAMMLTQDAMNKVTAKMTSLRTAMGKATSLTDYNKLNYDLQIQQRRYADLTKQMIQYKAQAAGVNTEVSKQSKLFTQLGSAMGMYLSVFQLFRFVKQIRDITGEFEYQRVALGHLIQDEEYGAQLFERIKAAAIESPFRVKDLVKYTKQLAAYRIEQESLFDTTKRLADISAGLGVDMNRLILAYGQVRAASVLRGQELRQFTEAGIPLVDELAKKFTELKGTVVSTADVFKLISARAVPFQYIAEIFEDLTDKGGMFYKMQEEQAKTLKGRWEKLKDAYDIALQAIGENDTFQKWNDKILDNLTSIAKNLRQIVRLVNAAGIAWGTYAIATRTALTANAKFTVSLVKEYGIVNTLKLGVGGLTAAFKKLVTVLKSNWVGLALSAVAGLITYFSAFKKKADEATDSVDKMEKAIEKMSQANKDSSKEERLIKRYEALSKNTNRTADENLALAQTITKLRDAYPELIDVIDNENTSLQKQVDALKNAREAKLDEAKKDAEEQLNIEKTLNEDLQKQYDDALKAYNDAYKKLIEAQGEKSKWNEKQKEANESLKDLLSEEDAEKLISDLDLDEVTKKAAILASEARAGLDAINEKLEKSNKQITRLENQIDPTKKQKDWSEWQNQIKGVQDSLLKVGDTPVFTDDEIGNFNSIYELSGKLKKKIDDLTTSIKGMKSMFDSMTDKGSDAAKALDSEIKASEKTLEIAEAIRIALSLTFSKSKGGAKTDPFITTMKERIKFMQDFKKGYDDLRKYMTDNKALAEEAGIMLGRGKSLGLDAKEQIKAANGLSGWYESMIKMVEDKLRGKGLKGVSTSDLLGIDTSKKSKAIQDLQKLLQELWDAKTDFDVSQKKKDLEDAMKKLAKELKHSEVAQNFYNDIFDLTGDEKLASDMTISVYGDIGADFKERTQQSLNKALASLDASQITEEMQKAFADQDFNKILSFIDKFSPEWQEKLNEMAEANQKYNADWLKDTYKTYQKTKTFEERISDVRKREQGKRQEISENKNLSPEQKASFLAASTEKEEREVADIQLEALKNTYEWTQAFKDMGRVSTDTLEELIKLLDEYIEKSGPNASPEALKAVTQAREQAQEQVVVRDAYSQAIGGLKRYIAAKKKANELEKQGKKNTEEYRRAQDKARDALEDTKKAVGAIGDSFNTLSSIVSSVSDMLDLDELSNGRAVLEGIATGLGLVGTALVFINAMFVLLETNPVVLAISAIIAGVAALASILSNLTMAKANREIKQQQDLIDDLEDSYKKLEKAIAQAFGSDYIYNYTEQLKNLQAQQEAYEKQAAAERSKGKKTDKDKVKEYEQSAKDTAEAIEDMSNQLSEFFAGTDVTSAAQDFADSWIEAYKEFGSTTDAMREKFEELIQNMITQSLAGKIMQSMLQPIFDAIDSFAVDGDFTAAEIAKIAAMANETIPQINDAMTGMMNSLAASGLNVRKTAGSFTGISRNIATASEESILGLAAGVNTANFYMSQIPTIADHVAAIREYLVGDTATGANTRAAGEEGPSYQDQMLAYAAYLPQMSNDVSAMRVLLDKVIKPKGVSSTHYVAIN